MAQSDSNQLERASYGSSPDRRGRIEARLRRPVRRPIALFFCDDVPTLAVDAVYEAFVTTFHTSSERRRLCNRRSARRTLASKSPGSAASTVFSGFPVWKAKRPI